MEIFYDLIQEISKKINATSIMLYIYLKFFHLIKQKLTNVVVTQSEIRLYFYLCIVCVLAALLKSIFELFILLALVSHFGYRAHYSMYTAFLLQTTNFPIAFHSDTHNFRFIYTCAQFKSKCIRKKNYC